MKVALVNTARGWGGAEEQMLVMAKELLKRGHEVTTIARAGGVIQKAFSEAQVPVITVNRKGIATIPAIIKLLTTTNKSSFDIIHCHRDHDLLLGKLLSIRCNAPLILTQHCLPATPSRLMYSMADQIITVSQYIANGITLRIPALTGHITVIPNGIDLNQFSNPDRTYWQRNPAIGERKPLLGTVGAFYKGQEELIALLPELLKAFPDLMLILIGEDEKNKPKMLNLAIELSVESALYFAGKIPRDQMKDALGSLDLNVSAFRNEGFGLSVIEGLAVGTPFVGYNTGGYPEIILDQKHGYLADESGQLCATIHLALSKLNAPEKTLALKLGQKNYDIQSMIDRYIFEYSQIREEV